MRTLAPFPRGLALLAGTAVLTSVAFVLLVRWFEPRLRAYEYGKEAYAFLLGVALLAFAQVLWVGIHTSHFWRWALLERSRRGSSPGTPTWDHPWDPSGIELGLAGAVWAGFSGWGKSMAATGWVWLLLLVVLLRQVGESTHFWAVATLVAVGPACWLGFRIFRASGAGRMAVRYPRFPLGGDGCATIRFETDPDGPSYRRLTFALRCRSVRSTYDWDLPEDGRAGSHFEVECVVPHDQGAPEAGGAVEVSFELPEDAPSTAFEAEPRCCYELAIDAETTAGRWTRRMLVPVYPTVRER